MLLIETTCATNSLEQLVNAKRLVCIVAVNVTILEASLLFLVFMLILHKQPVLESELADLIVVENHGNNVNILQVEKDVRVLAQVRFVALEQIVVVWHDTALKVEIANVVALHDSASRLLLLLIFAWTQLLLDRR